VRGSKWADHGTAPHPTVTSAIGGTSPQKEMVKVRVVKMLGLAGATALAVMAFMGAGTASADSACLEDPEGGAQGECPAGKVWEGPIIGLAKEVVISINDMPTKCFGEFLADWVKNEGKGVGVKYLILTFKLINCMGLCEFKKNDSENLPWDFLVLMAKQKPEEGGKEHAYLREDGKGRPAILLENCNLDSMLVDCLYEFLKEVLVNYFLEEKEGKPLVGSFIFNTGLTRGGDSPVCPLDGVSFEATYLIYEDLKGLEGSELFFTAFP
jgi:hypothetical protein